MSIINFLERLAEYFPSQDYQSRMDRFINAQHPKTSADVEHWEKQFHAQERRGLSL
jgi:hypothetical protein